MKNQKIILDLDGDKFEITNALIGARMVNSDNNPFSVYAGKMEIGEFGLSFLHIMRAVIKIGVEELGLSMSATKDFIDFTTKTAISLEKNRMFDFSKTNSMEDFVKKYMGNQF
jgi:hypothetical protein